MEEYEEYDEFRLISTGNGPGLMPHHIMKFQSANANLQTMTKPLKMHRKKQQQEAPEEETGPFKRKSKAFFFGREHQDVVLGGGDEIAPGTLIASIGSRHSDPDKSPWVLSDADGQEFTGNLEGSQKSNYVLFSSYNDGFKVIPVSKWYRFVHKATHRTLTLDEAEEKMKAKSKGSDRWLMRDDKKGGPPMKEWKKKLLGLDQEPSKEPKKQKVTNDDEIGLDYEDEFEDDEEVNFGLDDEDEVKEAKKRMHEKAIAGEQEEEDLFKSSSAKKLAQTLVKRENMDVYEDFGPENPYWSADEEEEEEEVKNPLTNNLLEKLKKSKADQKLANELKPPLSAESKSSQGEPSTAKRKREDELPPPPSAKEVVARELQKEKAKKRRSSASPAPASPNADVALPTEDDLIHVVKAKPNGITVKEIIQGLLERGFKVSNNQPTIERMKQLMKKCLDMDKQKQLWNLKPEFSQ